jgi:fatty acid desaturase
MTKKDRASGRWFRPVAWILAAFLLLAAGALAGVLAEMPRGFPLVVGGFAAYLWAFRRGLLLWKPGIDDLWSVRTEPARESREPAPTRPGPGQERGFGRVSRFPGTKDGGSSRRSAATARSTT